MNWLKPWMVTAPAALVVGGDLLFEPPWRVTGFFAFCFIFSMFVFPLWWIGKNGGFDE